MGGAGNPVYYSIQDVWVYHGGPITEVAKVREARWRLTEEGPLRSTAEMKGRLGAHEVEMRVSLYHTLERIDFDLTVDSVGGHGYFAANVPFGYGGELYAGIPFGAESRDLSREPFGEGAGIERLRENVFYAHHWVDYSDGQKGMTLLAAEGQRGFRFDPQTKSLDHILLMTIVPIPVNAPQLGYGTMAIAHRTLGEMETYFSNRYFRGTGRHTFHYSLILHSGDWRKAQSLLRAQEKLYPVRWMHVHPRAGANLPLKKSFLGVTPDRIALSSWFSKEDAYYLRLYETTGEEGPAEVRLPFEAGECESVDLNGRPSASPKISVQGGTARFHISPWEIVTLRFAPARGRG